MSRETAADWATYWRSADEPLEAMHAHFRGHVYHRHSHDSYSFGVTETGAQAFRCRDATHVSGAGMVMAFNPDDPHDGHAATGRGFRYRMVHVGPALVTEVLADVSGRPAGWPLFADPVLRSARAAAAVRRLHAALTGPASRLERDEQLTAAIAVLAGFAASRTAAPWPARPATREVAGTARRVRSFLDDRYATPVSAADLATAAGCSRYAAYRAFRAAYGLAPSDYQRQLRLRAARRALAQGTPAAGAAAAAGFADQAHLTRWFRRCYGITPGDFARAGRAVASS